MLHQKSVSLKLGTRPWPHSNGALLRDTINDDDYHNSTNKLHS